MDEMINPFKKAGTVLLVIGIIDIGYMAYCIVNLISYSSSFNIFAVIAGIFLIDGGVKTARAVRWFSVFLAICIFGLLLVTTLTTPFSLVLTQLKLNALSILGSLAFDFVFIAVLIWIHLQLSTPESLKILTQAGYKTGQPKLAFIAGGIILILSFIFSAAFLNGDSAQKAKELAQKQLGTKFQYHIASMTTSGNSGRAIVIAYTDKEIRNVQVQW